MSYDLYDRVLGCLLAAGMGDGIGAPTEGLSQDEIAAEYGKAVETFEDGSQNFYSLGNDVAEVTDDASQMYEMAKEIVSCGGVMTPQAAARAVVRWSESYPKYYPRNAGPTTSLVIEDLKNGADPIAAGMQGRRYGRGTSNGASMRVAAAGLTAVGDREKAIANAVAMSRPTHGTQHAFSGACAIACGVTEALKEDADVLSIVQACLYGARRGEEIGLATARRASGCSTVRCIERAVAAALPHEDMPSTPSNTRSETALPFRRASPRQSPFSWRRTAMWKRPSSAGRTSAETPTPSPAWRGCLRAHTGARRPFVLTGENFSKRQIPRWTSRQSPVI